MYEAECLTSNGYYDAASTPGQTIGAKLSPSFGTDIIGIDCTRKSQIAESAPAMDCFQAMRTYENAAPSALTDTTTPGMIDWTSISTIAPLHAQVTYATGDCPTGTIFSPNFWTTPFGDSSENAASSALMDTASLGVLDWTSTSTIVPHCAQATTVTEDCSLAVFSNSDVWTAPFDNSSIAPVHAVAAHAPNISSPSDWASSPQSDSRGQPPAIPPTYTAYQPYVCFDSREYQSKTMTYTPMGARDGFAGPGGGSLHQVSKPLYDALIYDIYSERSLILDARSMLDVVSNSKSEYRTKIVQMCITSAFRASLQSIANVLHHNDDGAELNCGAVVQNPVSAALPPFLMTGMGSNISSPAFRKILAVFNELIRELGFEDKGSAAELSSRDDVLRDTKYIVKHLDTKDFDDASGLGRGWVVLKELIRLSQHVEQPHSSANGGGQPYIEETGVESVENDLSPCNEARAAQK